MAGGSTSRKSLSQKASSQGAWLRSEICEGHIEALRHHRLLPPASQICAYLEILEKEGLLGRDLLTTMVTRRILPLQRRPHLVYQMSGRHDPCRLSTKRLTPSAVARRVNLISTAHMDNRGNWSWG
ncbi:hypothetical protein D1007_48216 [Hordeum vulgare]|nr:hypothetical protein D1007_48216 [Hordeum vulgare]